MTTDQPPPGGLAAAGLPPLAEAKLAPPRPRPGIVARPRIMEMLDGGWRSALTVVAAPAGYGKTTAVREWSAQRDAALAWVTLDASDADPVRLWTYAATAVDRVRQGLGARALRRLTVTGGPIENPIDELMEGIATLGRELVLVLDDLQAVTDPDCFASLEYAIRRVPANARLIAITRSDPPLPLAHLRARGMLAELRAGDLAFTASETREFLAEHGPAELAPEEVDQLQERTEGWPAALLLASLWLNSRDDLHGAVRRFGGDHRFVADYLSSEVLGSLDGGARSFLLGVAVLGRFTAALVDSVLGRSDSAAILADLERTNLFVERLELGGWYRVHSLFAEFAGFQLAAQEPEAVAEIHRRAAAWLRPRGLMVEAAEHAAAAGEHEMVAELLVEYHLPLIRGGGAGTLLRWVRALPERQLVLHPELAVGAATAATMVGAALERRQFLGLAERARVEEPARFTPYVEAVAAMVRASAVDRDVGEAVIQGRRAVALAQSGADDAIVAALGGMRAPCTSPVTSTRRGKRRWGRSSMPTSLAACRATPSPGRPWHWSRSTVDGSTRRGCMPTGPRRCSAAPAASEAGSARTPRRRSGRCWRRRATTPRPSARWSTRIASSAMRSRPCTTHGSWSCSRGSAAPGGGSTTRATRCASRRARSASSATAGACRRWQGTSSASSRRPAPVPGAESCSTARPTPSSPSCDCWPAICRSARSAESS